MIDGPLLPWAWALAWAYGALLGAIFFGGLCWTVRRGAAVRRPGPWFVASFVVRTALVLGGFYIVLSHRHWAEVGACALGFVVARVVVMGIARSSTWFDTGDGARRTEKAPHAHQP